MRGPAGCVYGAHAGPDARTDLGAGAAEGGQGRSKLRRNVAVEKIRPLTGGQPRSRTRRIEPGRRIIETVYAQLTDKGRADVTTP